MDVLSLSTPHCPFTGKPHPHPHPHPHPRPVSLSFSLKPQPEPQNNPFRRPETLKNPSTTTTTTSTTTSTSTPKTLKNPLKKPPPSSNVLPSQPQQPPPPPKTSHSLSSKLWLSSRISPPSPEPPPPSPLQNPDPELPSDSSPDDAPPPIDYRQLGKIFVGNLPSWIKKHEVAEFFRQFGPIKNVILIKGHNDTERNAGFGFVIYGGPTAATSAMKAVEFDGVEFHGRVLTVKLDDGRRQKAVAEERVRYVEGGSDGREYRSRWHEERDGSRVAFRKVLDTEPENWQAVVTAFDRIQKV